MRLVEGMRPARWSSPQRRSPAPMIAARPGAQRAPRRRANDAQPAAARLAAHRPARRVARAELLGGGLPLGGVLLVEEDERTEYALVLLRYFVAQTIAARHRLVIASAHEPPAELVRSAPAPVWALAEPAALGDAGGASSAASTEPDRAASAALRIAWRYQHLTPGGAVGPRIGSECTAAGFRDVFDLSQCMPEPTWRASVIAEVDLATAASVEELTETLLAAATRAAIASDAGSAGVLRIAVRSFAAPLWADTTTGDASAAALLRCLYHLRAMARRADAACVMLTAPTYLLSAPFVRQLEHLCDAVVRLDSFAGAGMVIRDTHLSEYHGFVRVIKLPQLYSLTSHSLYDRWTDLVFKLHARRRGFSIEKARLPPATTRADGAAAQPSQVQRGSCDPSVTAMF